VAIHSGGERQVARQDAEDGVAISDRIGAPNADVSRNDPGHGPGIMP
jgi:hypothetical protein